MNKPGQKRSFTRSWLDEQMKAQNIDAIKEWVSVYKSTAEASEKISMLNMLWDRLYPKARPVDESGEAAELNFGLTKDEIEAITKVARGEE